MIYIWKSALKFMDNHPRMICRTGPATRVHTEWEYRLKDWLYWEIKMLEREQRYPWRRRILRALPVAVDFSPVDDFGIGPYVLRLTLRIPRFVSGSMNFVTRRVPESARSYYGDKIPVPKRAVYFTWGARWMPQTLGLFYLWRERDET
jgi:hypothetical protein